MKEMSTHKDVITAINMIIAKTIIKAKIGQKITIHQDVAITPVNFKTTKINQSTAVKDISFLPSN